MSIQDCPSHKAFATLCANVRSFTCVITFVDHQRGPLGERFTTLITRILSLTCVRHIVCP